MNVTDAEHNAMLCADRKWQFALARSAMRERKLHSECFASQTKPTVSDVELLSLGEVQVVRRPPTDGRPAQIVTRGPILAKRNNCCQAIYAETTLPWHSSVWLLHSCMRA